MGKKRSRKVNGFNPMPEKHYKEWLKDLVRFNGLKKVTRPVTGSIVSFHYFAKHYDTLPFFNLQPIAIPIEYYSDGFLGLNLNYVPPIHRVAVMLRLKKIMNIKGIGENKRLAISYATIRGFSKAPILAPTVKRYLYSHLRSGIYQIPESRWMDAVLLPNYMQKWYNAQPSEVHKISKSLIAKIRRNV